MERRWLIPKYMPTTVFARIFACWICLIRYPGPFWPIQKKAFYIIPVSGMEIMKSTFSEPNGTASGKFHTTLYIILTAGSWRKKNTIGITPLLHWKLCFSNLNPTVKYMNCHHIYLIDTCNKKSLTPEITFNQTSGSFLYKDNDIKSFWRTVFTANKNNRS